VLSKVFHAIPLAGAPWGSPVKAASRRLRRWPAASLARLRPMSLSAAVIDGSGCHRGSRARHLLLAESIAHGRIEPDEKLAHHRHHDHLARFAAGAQAIA